MLNSPKVIINVAEVKETSPSYSQNERNGFGGKHAEVALHQVEACCTSIEQLRGKIFGTPGPWLRR